MFMLALQLREVRPRQGGEPDLTDAVADGGRGGVHLPCSVAVATIAVQTPQARLVHTMQAQQRLLRL